jgi:DNA-binding PadR family transcriptional regulator
MSLKYAILGAIVDRPSTGYEITKRMDGSIGFFWGSPHQQVYRELAVLDEEGWVAFQEEAQEGKPDKKIYSLTEKGTQELKTWIARPLEESRVKDSFLLKVFCGHLIAPEVLREEVLLHQKAHQQRYLEYQKIEREHFSNPDQLPKRGRFQYLALRRGLIFEKGWLSWCREILALLEDQ